MDEIDTKVTVSMFPTFSIGCSILWQPAGCQPPPVSYRAFPTSSPERGLHRGKRARRSCIEETWIVIGFFAKIVGTERQRGGGQLTARFARLLFNSHPPEPPAAHHKQLGTLHDAAKTHIAFPHSTTLQASGKGLFRFCGNLTQFQPPNIL